MKRWLAYSVWIIVCIPLETCCMDKSADKGKAKDSPRPTLQNSTNIEIVVKTAEKAAEKIVINSADQLAKYVLQTKTHLTDQQIDALELTPAFTAQILVGTLSFGEDALQTRAPHIHRQLEKSLSTTSHDLSATRLQKRVIIEQARKHDGNLTARSIQDRKRQSALTSSTSTPLVTPTSTANNLSTPSCAPVLPTIASTTLTPTTSTSLTTPVTTTTTTALTTTTTTASMGKQSSTVPHLALADLLPHNTNTIEAENSYDEDLARVKQEMRELVLKAAEDAIESSKSDANRNAYLGAGSTLGGTIISAIVTYFSTKSTTGSSGCTPPTNSTST